MIKELFELGYLNIEKMIVSEAKNLEIKPIEAMVLIEIINCYKKNKKIDKSIIMFNLRQPNDIIDDALNTLLEKTLYEIYLSYEGAKAEEYISIDPLFKKLEETTITPSVLKIENEMEEIINIIQTKMNKMLTPNELEYVKEWVFDLGYNKQRILDVINVIESANKKITFRNLMTNIDNKGMNNHQVNKVNDLLSRMKR